jgi:ATP-dependent exoDNAse (exonuclease V) alpha subunit
LFDVRIGGFAGTGKTTLIAQFRRSVAKRFRHINVAFVTFTGKASFVLKTKLESVGAVFPGDHVGTIHSLIYTAIQAYDPDLKAFVIKGWKLKTESDINYDLIIIDEASMVSKKIWKDLHQYNIPIIAVGDHGQLPPVDTNSFNLMKKPDFVLTEIHRQSENSPIINLSKFIRKKGQIPFNTVFSPDPFVGKMPWYHTKCQKIWEDIDFDEETVALCGFNYSRCQLNKDIRKRKGYNSPIPFPGERVVCLKNNHELGIMNGQTGTVIFVMPEIPENTVRMTLKIDGFEQLYECFVDCETFGKESSGLDFESKRYKKLAEYARQNRIYGGVNIFDYGYCISVHKSQGSEWDRVVLFEQKSRYWDSETFTKWLYTGVTRAKEKLLIISDYWG